VSSSGSVTKSGLFDPEPILAVLERHGVEYVLVGGFAARMHGATRPTRDVDVTPSTPHDLRHTAASLAVASGATVKSVQRMLGHASAAMTLDVYSGLFDDDLTALADRMDAAARAAADARVGAVWAWPPAKTAVKGNIQVSAVGPVGIEPTTRGLKVRCSAS